MDFSQAMEYLDSLYGLGSDLGLKRVSILMEKLGNPQDKIKTIHVAGTNGKGSTCSMISSILMEEGYRVGVYTSPHLEEYNERYTINNIRISDEELGHFMGTVKEKCDELKEEGIGQPTVFEVVTALGFLYFAEKNVDYLLLEVGLGGRADATNIIKSPLISIITSISMDHMEYLGDNLEKIAYEKGGIIKEGCPTVLYTQSSEVYKVIKNICEEKESKLYYAHNQGTDVILQTIEKTVFNIENEFISYKNMEIDLIGDYQINNAATALLAAKALTENGVKISENSIYSGLMKARWSGRMEIIGRDPIIILDGAHNDDGISMLTKSMKHYFPDNEITLLVGILGDKEHEKMVENLLPLATKVVLTEPNNSRKWNVYDLKEDMTRYKAEIFREKDIAKAFKLAKSITKKEGVLCCAGSLYLIGELYKLSKESTYDKL